MPGLSELGLKPAAPALETLLARADIVDAAGSSFESTLFGLFGIPDKEHIDLPSAAISRLAESGKKDDAFWFHADPVFLKATADRLLLFDAEMLDIRPEDAEALIKRFNQHFSEDGWHLEASHPNRWYLRLPKVPALSTSPLGDVVGRNIDHYLPTGDEAKRWRSVLNEIQMLFHSATANMQREADSLLPINGIWLSGGGCLPKVKPRFTQVMANDLLCRGLADLSEVQCHALSLNALTQKHEDGSAYLVSYSSLLRTVLAADPEGWVKALDEFEHWLAALQRMLQKRQIRRLSLYPCDGSAFQIERQGLRRFWKPRRSITGYLLGRK